MPVPRRREALLALLAAAAAPGSAAAQSGAEADAAPRILEFRDRIKAAVTARDRPTLERLYHDGFMHLRDSGRVDHKADRIALLLSGEVTIETAREEQVVVQAFGPTTAAATGVSAIKDGAGKPIRFRWLTVYVKDALGDWRVAVSQASRAGRR
jgi:ketosteroid isomerase-like protein